MLKLKQEYMTHILYSTVCPMKYLESDVMWYKHHYQLVVKYWDRELQGSSLTYTCSRFSLHVLRRGR